MLDFEEEAQVVKDVEITEVDIDKVICAKGAIFSAIRTMLSYCDFDISMIEWVYVAGGIGSVIIICGMPSVSECSRLFRWKCTIISATLRRRLRHAVFHIVREKVLMNGRKI